MEEMEGQSALPAPPLCQCISAAAQVGGTQSHPTDHQHLLWKHALCSALSAEGYLEQF